METFNGSARAVQLMDAISTPTTIMIGLYIHVLLEQKGFRPGGPAVAPIFDIQSLSSRTLFPLGAVTRIIMRNN
jgi:hypothetical protein